MTLKLEIVNRSPHPLPAYQTEGSAGMDLRAWLESPLVLRPMERVLVSTGIYLALPQGIEAQIRPRSGTAIKKGLTLVNSPGTVDSDYRGEIRIPLVNLSAEDQTVEDGERIAQMVVARHETVAWVAVDTLEETARGAGGFGHSGIH